MLAVRLQIDAADLGDEVGVGDQLPAPRHGDDRLAPPPARPATLPPHSRVRSSAAPCPSFRRPPVPLPAHCREGGRSLRAGLSCSAPSPGKPGLGPAGLRSLSRALSAATFRLGAGRCSHTGRSAPPASFGAFPGTRIHTISSSIHCQSIPDASTATNRNSPRSTGLGRGVGILGSVMFLSFPQPFRTGARVHEDDARCTAPAVVPRVALPVSRFLSDPFQAHQTRRRLHRLKPPAGAAARARRRPRVPTVGVGPPSGRRRRVGQQPPGQLPHSLERQRAGAPGQSAQVRAQLLKSVVLHATSHRHLVRVADMIGASGLAFKRAPRPVAVQRLPEHRSRPVRDHLDVLFAKGPRLRPSVSRTRQVHGTVGIGSHVPDRAETPAPRRPPGCPSGPTAPSCSGSRSSTVPAARWINPVGPVPLIKSRAAWVSPTGQFARSPDNPGLATPAAREYAIDHPPPAPASRRLWPRPRPRCRLRRLPPPRT